MDFLSLLEFEESGTENQIIARRVVRDAENPLEYWEEEEFRSRYRFSKTNFLVLLNQLETDLKPNSDRNAPVPPMFRLLIALRFFATGQFQKTDGDLMQVHQTSVSRIVKQVATAIAKRRREYIKYPTENEKQLSQQNFYSKHGMPKVIGLIDCTHVPIVSPGGENAEVFRNRKGFFSINVQLVCQEDMKFFDIVARWPGSTHDSRIFDNSMLKDKLEEEDSVLLGDGGYRCDSHMLTPLLDPTCPAERRYNKAHIATRGLIERSFGVMKQRFRCLRTPLRTKLNTSLTIIVAVACLHNQAISFRESLNEEENTLEGAVEVGGEIAPSNVGETMRYNVIRNFFN